jgi:hypothetical protein
MRYLPIRYLDGGGAPPVVSRLAQQTQSTTQTGSTSQPVAVSSSGAWLKWTVIVVAVWLLLEVL